MLDLEQKNKQRMALIYAITAQFFFSYMYYGIYLLRGQHSSLQILNARMTMGYVLNVFFCSINKFPTYIEDPKVFKLVSLRGMIGGSSMLCVFSCLSLMNISDGVVLINTNPIWTSFSAAFFLGEKLSLRTIILCVIAFFGIILIYRPASLFGELGPQSEDQHKNKLLGSIFGLGASFSIAGAATVVRKLSHSHKVPSPTQMQYYYFIGLMISTVIYICNYQPYVITLRFVGISFALSLSSFIGQLLFQRAFAFEKASIISPLGYLQVVLSFIQDIFLLDAGVQFTSIIGAALIVVCSIAIAL